MGLFFLIFLRFLKKMSCKLTRLFRFMKMAGSLPILQSFPFHFFVDMIKFDNYNSMEYVEIGKSYECVVLVASA